MVGNKIDRYEYVEVEESEGVNLANELGAIFQLTSAKESSGVEELFEKIGKKYLNIEQNNVDKSDNQLDLDNSLNDSNISKTDIFTGLCKEENHNGLELEYYCKNHRQLCCAACICKIKGKGKGNHNDCEVCFIEEVKDLVYDKINSNIKFLEELSNNLSSSINKSYKSLKNIKKDNIELMRKIKIYFKDIRNALNKREEEILLNIDSLFNDLFAEGELFQKIEDLKITVNKSLEDIKDIKSGQDKEPLNSVINNNIQIENQIIDINKINKELENQKLLTNLNIKFICKDDDFNKFLESIKLLGDISVKQIFKFKECPENINENKAYIINEEGNIITKSGSDGWTGIICENILSKSEEYKWTIKILKSENYDIMVGVAPIDFDINTSLYTNSGWYFNCLNSELYSGPPHNYNKNKTNLRQPKDEINIIMNMDKGTLKFIINNEDNGESFSNIPLDKPVTPIVFLYHKNDSIEIL